jgi:hypothetical protein
LHCTCAIVKILLQIVAHIICSVLCFILQTDTSEYLNPSATLHKTKLSPAIPHTLYDTSPNLSKMGAMAVGKISQLANIAQAHSDEFHWDGRGTPVLMNQDSTEVLINKQNNHSKRRSEARFFIHI